MAPEEERLTRLRQQRSERAIALAMEGRWQEAAAVNQEIIKSLPKDVEAYNRLGRAYIELGDYLQAREAYSRALGLDPYNVIAQKNLQRLSYLKGTAGAKGAPDKVEPQHFIEEIGKARVVNLYYPAPKEMLARVVAGDKVYLKIDASNLVAENGQGEYLGLVGLKHARRLIRLMAGGNEYSAAVISSTEDMMTIIIREVYQDPSQAGRLSFPSKGLEEVHPPYVTDKILRLEPEYEEGLKESGYTIIGGEEIEVLPEEPGDIDEDTIDDED